MIYNAHVKDAPMAGRVYQSLMYRDPSYVLLKPNRQMKSIASGIWFLLKEKGSDYICPLSADNLL